MPLLAMAGFVWGASSDAFIQGCEVALVDLCDPDDLPVALGRVNAYGAIGDLLGPLTLAGVVALGWSWRVPFIAGAGLMVLYAVMLALQPFPKPRGEASEPVLVGILSVMRDRRVVLLALIDALFALLDEPLLGFLTAFLERVRGWTPSAATAAISIIVAGQLIGFLGVGRLTERVKPRTAMLLTGVVMGVSLALLVIAPWAAATGVASLTFGLSSALFYSVLQATYMGLRPGQAGTTGAVVSAIGLAGMGFPALVGAVSDARGLPAGLGLYVAVPALILALLLIERRLAD